MATKSAEQRWPQLFRTYPRKENNVNQAQLSPRGWRIVGELAGFNPTEAKQFSQIVKGESGFRPGVLGHDPNGYSTGVGGPQNTPEVWGDAAKQYLAKLGGEKVLTNPYKAAQMARFLYESAGNTWSPWYGTRYLDRSAHAKGSVLPQNMSVGKGSVSGPGSSTVPIPTSKEVTEFDKGGYEQAQKMQLLASFLSKPGGSAVDGLLGGNVKSPLDSGSGTGSSLFKTGLLSTDPVSAADFMEQKTVTGTKKIKVPGPGPVGGGAGGPVLAGTAHRTASQMLSLALKVDKKHPAYLLGGGHGLTPAQLGELVDCSGFVSQILGISPRVSGQYESWGKPGRGKFVTVYANDHHVFMSIRDPRTKNMRWFGTSRSNPGGGAGEMPAPPASYLATFAARHPGRAK